MPTASQCLILMGDEECADRLSLRRYSGVNANVSMPDMFANQVRECDTETPEYSALPSLFCPIADRRRKPYQLVVNGYKGTMKYDTNSKSFRWQLSSKNPQNMSLPRQQISLDLQASLNIKTSGNHQQNLVKPIPVAARKMERKMELDGTPNYPTSADSIISRDEEINGREKIPLQYGMDAKSYERLENLGFRRRKKRRNAPVKKLDMVDDQNLAGKTQTVNYIPTPPGEPKLSIGSSSSVHLDRGSSGNAAHRSDHITSKTSNAENSRSTSLLDEDKQKVTFDSHIFPVMHMRKTLPESDPRVACFSLMNEADLSHRDVVELVQSQTGCDVKAIQYDPVSLRAGANIGSRWIITFESSNVCKRVVRRGLVLDGSKIIVKFLDEVYLFEYTTFLAKQEEVKNEARNRENSSKRILNDGKRYSERSLCSRHSAFHKI